MNTTVDRSNGWKAADRHRTEALNRIAAALEAANEATAVAAAEEDAVVEVCPDWPACRISLRERRRTMGPFAAEAIEERHTPQADAAHVERLTGSEFGVLMNAAYAPGGDLYAVASLILTQRIAADRAEQRAEAWVEGAEATAEWMANNPGPSGIPHDPPRNPYEED